MLRSNKHNDRPRELTKPLSGHADDWEELAVDYIDGRLKPEIAAIVERHLQECSSCAERLQNQRRTLRLLQEIPLEPPPEDLEQQILEDLDHLLLSPQPEPVTAQPLFQVDTPSRWTGIWRKRIRPWVPATLGVLAVLAVIVGYGILRPHGDRVATYDATTSVAVSYATREAASDNAQETTGTAAALDAMATTETETASTMTGGMEVTGTQPTVETTSSTEPDTSGSSPVAAAAQPSPQDRKTMIAAMKSADAPVYFVFDAANGETGTETLKEDVVQQITLFTSLEPVDSTLWLGGPTFAAFLPREDIEELVDLLRSISASLQVPLTLYLEPLPTAADSAARLIERKGELPELSAKRKAPAVSGWTFTTSTLPRAEDTAKNESGEATLDDTTHVLVIICVPE